MTFLAGLAQAAQEADVRNFEREKTEEQRKWQTEQWQREVAQRDAEWARNVTRQDAIRAQDREWAVEDMQTNMSHQMRTSLIELARRRRGGSRSGGTSSGGFSQEDYDATISLLGRIEGVEGEQADNVRAYLETRPDHSSLIVEQLELAEKEGKRTISGQEIIDNLSIYGNPENLELPNRPLSQILADIAEMDYDDYDQYQDLYEELISEESLPNVGFNLGGEILQEPPSTEDITKQAGYINDEIIRIAGQEQVRLYEEEGEGSEDLVELTTSLNNTDNPVHMQKLQSMFGQQAIDNLLAVPEASSYGNPMYGWEKNPNIRTITQSTQEQEIASEEEGNNTVKTDPIVTKEVQEKADEQVKEYLTTGSVTVTEELKQAYPDIFTDDFEVGEEVFNPNFEEEKVRNPRGSRRDRR